MCVCVHVCECMCVYVCERGGEGVRGGYVCESVCVKGGKVMTVVSHDRISISTSMNQTPITIPPLPLPLPQKK